MNNSYELKKKLKAPFSIGIEITAKCNLSCEYCSFGYNICQEELPIADIKRLFDECKNIGVAFLNISGGEPFMRTDIFEVLDLIDESINFTLLSNGTLITRSMAERLSQYSNLRGIGISIDSIDRSINDATRGKGTLEKTVKGINNLKVYNIRFGLMATVNKLNADNLEELISFSESSGAQNIAFNRPLYIGKGENEECFDFSGEEYRRIAQNLYDIKKEKKNKVEIGEWEKLAIASHLKNEIDQGTTNEYHTNNGCSLGFGSLFIKFNGNVLACSFIENQICGNIKENSLLDIWDNSEVLEELREKSKIRNNCLVEKCRYKSICLPGCAIYREDITNRNSRDRFFCLNI